MVSYTPTPGPQPVAPGLSLQPQAIPPGPPTNWRGAGSVKRGMLADGILAPEHVADPDVFFARKERYAAFSGKGPKGTGAFCYVTWDPSDDNTITLFLSSTETPAASVQLLGHSGSSTRWNLLLTTNGEVSIRQNTTKIVTSAVGAFLFDGSLNTIRIALGNDAGTLTVNGVAVAGTYGPVTWSSETCYVGAANTAAAQRFPGAIWNVSLTDNVTPANSVVLRMDERVGNYRNSYSGTTAAAYATRNGTVASIVIHDTDGSALPVPAVSPARMRYAACSGLGASSTAGAFASVSWAPVAGTSFRLGATIASAVTPSAGVYVVGRKAANCASILVATDGTVSITANASGVLSTSAGAVRFEGSPFDIRADVTDTTGSIYINGALVASGTFGAQTWSTGAATNNIGASSTSSTQRWPGSIHNVEFTDYVTAANSLFYLLDEPSGNYADTSGNGGAAATRNGYVPNCAVVSTDGRGMVYQGQAPLFYRSGSAAVTGITGVTSWAFVGTDGEIDPTTSWNGATGTFTAPVAGTAVITFSGGVQATTLAGTDVIYAQVAGPGGATDQSQAWITLTTASVWVPFTCTLVTSMAAASTAVATLQSLLAGDVYSVNVDTNVSIMFYPTPIAS